MLCPRGEQCYGRRLSRAKPDPLAPFRRVCDGIDERKSK